MGKVYQFPTQRKTPAYKEAKYQQDFGMLRDLMETLVLTYEDKIEELNQYKREISALDGMTLKSPREVTKEVKKLRKMFSDFGITCNFFKFFTKDNLEILYYNESESVYAVKDNKVEEAKRMSVGEFIQEFEGYPFSLSIDAAVTRIFDTQVNNLNITIATLKNTQV